MDRLDQILEVRERARQELGIAFHLHSDACYGGYAASVTWRAEGTRRTAAEVRSATGTSWPSDDWMRGMVALAGADSVTIDPHKLGYVPYPAGAFLLKDRRARELVAIDPPYLVPAGAAGWRVRSRPRSLPGPLHLRGLEARRGRRRGLAEPQGPPARRTGLRLSDRAHRRRSPAAARRARSARYNDFDVVVLPEPDINIVCFIARHPDLRTLAELNELNEEGVSPDEPHARQPGAGIHHYPHPPALADVRWRHRADPPATPAPARSPSGPASRTASSCSAPPSWTRSWHPRQAAWITCRALPRPSTAPAAPPSRRSGRG